MNFSPHFTLGEFERNSRGLPNIIPPELYPVFTALCIDLLEPIRGRFGRPMHITSGYRSKELNGLVGGSNKSHHKATKDYCAADFQIPGLPLQEVFDWIRLQSGLPFDQVILERGHEERHENEDCIHISYLGKPRRMALEGFTANKGRYLARYVAPLVPEVRSASAEG